MINFCKNFLKNNIYDQILSDSHSLCLFNKQELDFLYFYLIKDNVYNIQYIKNPSVELELESVKQDYWMIKYISQPSEQVQLEVVKRNGYVIQYIKNPLEKIQY